MLDAVDEVGQEAVGLAVSEEEDGAEGDATESVAVEPKRRCPLCSTPMDSYLVDEKRKLHVCHNSPDCAGTAIEEGAFNYGPDRTKVADVKGTVPVTDGLVVRLGRKILRVRLS